MTTTLTIAADDFALAGTIPAVGAQFIITPVHVSINSTTDQIVSGKSFGVTVDATGAASTAIPDALAGNGLSIWSTLQGWVTVAVANYPTGTISLPDLINGYSVDPTTLAVTAANSSAWVTALAAVTASDALKAPLASPAFTGTPTGITKAHVGLGNVDNTSDVNKPVSTAQATAIGVETARATGAEGVLTASDALKVPRWQPFTPYAANYQVVSPNNDVVSALTAHTSGATYTAGNWALSATFAQVFTPEKYGAIGNGVTDDTAAVQATLQAAYTAGGGTIMLSQSKTYLCNGQLTIPNDGLTFPGGKYIRITGNGYDGVLYPAGAGAKLDLRYSGTGAKIMALARGVLELDHFTLTDNGTSSTPFLLTTNTIINAHDMSVLGNPSKSGVTCDQDVFIFGGTVATAGGLVTSGFQGYGSSVTHVQFGRIRRAAYLRVWANSIVIRDNNISSSCGANGTQAAIELDPTADAAGMAWGNVIAGNLIECVNYTRGILCIGAARNQFEHNSFWDQMVSGYVGDYNFTTSSIENHIVTGGPSSHSATHIIEDTSSLYKNGVEGIYSSADGTVGLGLSGRVNMGSRTPNARIRVDAPILLGGTSADGLATGVTVQSQATTPEAGGTRVQSWKINPNDATNPGVELGHLNNDGTLYMLAPNGGKIGSSTVRVDNGGLTRYSGNGLTIDPAAGNTLFKAGGVQINSTGGGVVQYSGSGAPAISAALGDAYWRKDGGAMTWLYRCTTAGSATTGAWTGVL